MEGGFGNSRCKISCIEWINSKVLLYSLGNYVQYPVINLMEKGMKNNVCIWITESVCYTAETTRTLSINYTSIK